MKTPKLKFIYIFNLIATVCFSSIAMEKPAMQIICTTGEVVEIRHDLVPWLLTLHNLNDKGIMQCPLPFEKQTLESVITCLSNIKDYRKTRNELLQELNKPLFNADLGDEYIPDQVYWAVWHSLPSFTITTDDVVALMLAADYLEAPYFLMNAYGKLWAEKKFNYEKYYAHKEYTNAINECETNESIPLLISKHIVKHCRLKQKGIWKEVNVADVIAENEETFQTDFGQPTLYLEDNLITSLDGINQIHNKHRLQRLFLNNNRLSIIKPIYFQDFTELQELDLSHNELSNVNFVCFEPLVNLKYLNLEKNNLAVIDPTPLQKLPCLIYFFFDEDKLRQENRETIARILPNVKTDFY